MLTRDAGVEELLARAPMHDVTAVGATDGPEGADFGRHVSGARKKPTGDDGGRHSATGKLLDGFPVACVDTARGIEQGAVEVYSEKAVLQGYRKTARQLCCATG